MESAEETTTAVATAESPLVQIVQSSGLEKTKAEFVLEKFKDFFDVAADWERKTKLLVVTSPTQTAEMKMAREGRLFLKGKRLEIEKARKELKEQSLREGKAIDGIANVLKGLIEPIEEYLDKQERFVEIREEEALEGRKAARIIEMQSIGLDIAFYDVKNMTEDAYKTLCDGQRRALKEKKEAEERAEAERVAKEKADAEERERMKAENERLQKEAEEKEKLLAIERAESVRKQKEAEEKAKREREAAEAKAKKEREAAEKKAAEERATAEAREKKLKAEADAKLEKERKERERLEQEIKEREEAEAKEKKRLADAEAKAKKAPDKQKLLALADGLGLIKFPDVTSPEAKKVIDSTKTLIAKTSAFIREQTEKL